MDQEKRKGKNIEKIFFVLWLACVGFSAFDYFSIHTNVLGFLGQLLILPFLSTIYWTIPVFTTSAMWSHPFGRAILQVYALNVVILVGNIWFSVKGLKLLLKKVKSEKKGALENEFEENRGTEDE